MALPLSDVRAFQRDPLSLVTDRAASAEPGFVPLYLTLRPIWMATDPELARSVLKAKTDEVDKGHLVQRLRPIMGESLLTNVGDSHSRTKAAIHRHVQRNAAAANLDGMLAAINHTVARVTADGYFDCESVSAPLALQLGCIALFGHDVITVADRVALISAVRAVEGELADDMFRMFPSPPWRARERERRLANARSIVDEVVTRARRSKNRSPIMLALEGAGLTDEQIRAEILGLLIAGHHTTGATISWIVYHLALDPTISDMIALEADEMLDALEDGDAGALRRAPLSLAFAREILRLYPAGWWTSREVMRTVVIGGKTFRAGDVIMVSPWQLHRDQRFWADPDVLKLDRDFTADAYMPFGVGPRSCIGQSIAWFELQLATLQLSSAFTFSMAANARLAIPRPSVTLLAPDLRFKVHPRRQSVMWNRENVA